MIFVLMRLCAKVIMLQLLHPMDTQRGVAVKPDINLKKQIIV